MVVILYDRRHLEIDLRQRKTAELPRHFFLMSILSLIGKTLLAHCTYTFNVMVIFLHNFISIFIRVLRIGVYIDIRALDI